MAGKYLNIRDMLDGGGAGASGSEFKGGAMSNILNALGIKPAGYRDRAGNMGQAAPQRPARVNRAPATTQAAHTPPAPVYSGRGNYGMMTVGGTNPVTPYGEAARFNRPAAPAVMSMAPQMPPPVVSPQTVGRMPAAPIDPAITSRTPTTAGPDSKSFQNFLAYLAANDVDSNAINRDRLEQFYKTWANIPGI